MGVDDGADGEGDECGNECVDESWATRNYEPSQSFLCKMFVAHCVS